MKKVVLLFVIVFSIVACEENVSFNDVAMQGRINNAFWKAVNVSAVKNSDGTITLSGINGFDQLDLKIASSNLGTYPLGTNNANNFAFYTFFQDKKEYETSVYASPVNQIKLINTGSGYLDTTSLATSGGSGSGLRVNIKADLFIGAITEVQVNAPGTGYKSGDLITISTGNNNATFEVINVTKSNGEITITDNSAGTITGSFKLTAVNEANGETVIFRDGLFYQIPVK